jgi:phi13 family phage major tail protein
MADKKQKRGCSRLHYAPIVANTAEALTFGEPKMLARSKTISATLEQSSEGVWADNKRQYNVRSGVSNTRTFDVFPIAEETLADIFGDSLLEVGGSKVYGVDPDAEFSEMAYGYALHDGDEDKPCELVWAFIGVPQKRPDETASTIDSGTGSEGQQLVVDFFKPEKAFTATGKKNLFIKMTVTEDMTAADINKWFEQVVTWDNISTIYPAT